MSERQDINVNVKNNSGGCWTCAVALASVALVLLCCIGVLLFI